MRDSGKERRRERDTKKEGGMERERDRERERKSVCDALIPSDVACAVAFII